MQSQVTQLRVTLSVQLQEYLQTKASRLGLNMSAYVKNLIINDIKDVDYPVFQASERTEEAYKRAKHAEQNGKLVSTNNISSFLNNL